MQTDKDVEMLAALAELRVATGAQLAAWLGVSERVGRRRAAKLVELGLAESGPRAPGQGPGRPEWVFSTSARGVAVLEDAGVLAPEVPPERVTADALDRLREHQLLLNAVAIQCRELDRAGAGFRVRFLSSTSPFHLSDLDGSVLADRVEFPDGSELGFVPDAAFAISHAGVGKTLLFFLEVDMGTETLVDPKGRWDRDIWGKVVVYRTYLGRQGYRRYESEGFFGPSLHGFRLLMVCASAQRARAVGRMVGQNRPSDFVWVTAAPDLLRKGLGAHVWKPGGNLQDAGSSILGSLAPPRVPDDDEAMTGDAA